jgi:hypothetical protein
MTVLEALAILEAATLECKKRDIDTPEIHEALTLFERAPQARVLLDALVRPHHFQSTRALLVISRSLFELTHALLFSLLLIPTE